MSISTGSTDVVTQADRGGYLLGSSDVEVQRLIDQANLFVQEAGWLLAEVGDCTGGSALDLGCGPIGVLPLLAGKVGASGRVVGVDLDPAMLAHAERACREAGIANAELHVVNATATGLPQDSFDLAHVRLVLVNVADPAAVVAELVRVTKPGGTVAVHEIDWMTWQCEPAHPAWTALRDLLHRLWASRGFDTHIGRRLPRLLTEAGLSDVRAMSHAGVDDDTHPYQRLILDFTARFTPQLVGLGLATEETLRELTAALADHLGRPGTIVFRALTVQSWGRVPEERT